MDNHFVSICIKFKRFSRQTTVSVFPIQTVCCRWLEEINKGQAEIVAARVSAEKFRQRDQVLTTENEKMKVLSSNAHYYVL